jgi:hypothetical protein
LCEAWCSTGSSNVSSQRQRWHRGSSSAQGSR